jgi:hypothetical protein
MSPSPSKAITVSIDRRKIRIATRAVDLGQTKNGSGQLSLFEYVTLDKNFFVKVIQLIRGLRLRAVRVKRIPKWGIFGQQALLHLSGLKSRKAAVCSVHIAATQRHEALGATCKRMYSSPSISLSHRDHMNDDFKLGAHQIYREVQNRYSGFRASEVAEPSQQD